MASPSFFVKIKVFFVFIWDLIKKWIKGRPNINVERAEKVIIYAPAVSGGRDVKDVTITIKPRHWTERVKSAESIIPTAIGIPKSPSLNDQAILVYKSIIRRLEKASKVLDPVVAQALYLCCTHKAAILAKNNDLAKFVEEKLEKISSFRSEDGYIPPDINKWYKRFREIDLRGNLAGVVIPVLEYASEKLASHPQEFRGIKRECRRFIRWLHTSMLKPEEQRFYFKGEHLNVGLVFVAELDWLSYTTIGMKLLTEQECDLLIVMAYGSDYTIKSVNASCFLDRLRTREIGLSRVILTPTLESYDAKPCLASYFFLQPYFSEEKNKLIKRWEQWELKLPNQSKVNVMDEEIGFAQISKLISHGNAVMVEHAWDTLKPFLDVCFQAIIENRAKIVCHKIEMRTNGGVTKNKPWARLSLVLAPPVKL